MKKKRVRNQKIEVYVTNDELNIINKKMKQSGIKNRSEYIRKAALEEQIINIDLSYLDKVIYELNKIGVNINQIAKTSNANGYVYNSELREINEYMKIIWQKVSEVF